MKKGITFLVKAVGVLAIIHYFVVLLSYLPQVEYYEESIIIYVFDFILGVIGFIRQYPG
mgnify:CR=1 FL=1